MIQESPLIKTLQLLSKQELEMLAGFVKSEIFHRDLGRLNSTGRLFEQIQGKLQENNDAFRESELMQTLFSPSLKKPKRELYRLMSQLFDVVKQYITFSNFISTPDGHSKKQPSTDEQAPGMSKRSPQRMKEMKEDAGRFLSYARRELALMRFYNQRINLRPISLTATTSPKKAADKQSKVKKPENFFTSAYFRLKEYMLLDQQAQLSYQTYSESEYAELLYHNFLLEHEMFVFQNIANQKKGDINLLAVTSALDQFYFLNRLELTLRWHMQTMVSNPYGEDAEALKRRQVIEAGLEKFVLLAQELDPSDHPLLGLYIKSIALIKAQPGGGDALYADLLRDVGKWENRLPMEKRNDLYTVLRNYLAHAYNHTKNRDYLAQLHQFHKTHLEKGYLTFATDGKRCIHPSQLQGIISLASKMDDLDWALTVLEQFPPDRIVPAQQAAAIRKLNFATILLEQKKYAEALKALGDPKKFREIKELHYRLLANRVYAKLLFETGDLGDYDGKLFLKTTRAWIKREKDLEKVRQDSNDAFFDCTAQIFKLKHLHPAKPGDAFLPDLTTIFQAIKTAKPAEYEWLVQKIEQLGTALVKSCLENRDFAAAGQATRKMFGGYSKTLKIHHAESRNQMLVCTAKLLYELNWLNPQRRITLLHAALDYVKKNAGLGETEQKEYASFLERVHLLCEIRDLKTQKNIVPPNKLQAVQNRLFRALEDGWINEKITELNR